MWMGSSKVKQQKTRKKKGRSGFGAVESEKILRRLSSIGMSRSHFGSSRELCGMNNGIKVAISGSNSRFVVGPSARFQPNFSQSCDNTRRLEMALNTECWKKGAIVLFCGKSAVFETTKTADETRQNIFVISICFVSLSFFLVFPITIGIFIKFFARTYSIRSASLIYRGFCTYASSFLRDIAPATEFRKSGPEK